MSSLGDSIDQLLKNIQEMQPRRGVWTMDGPTPDYKAKVEITSPTRRRYLPWGKSTKHRRMRDPPEDWLWLGGKMTFRDKASGRKIKIRMTRRKRCPGYSGTSPPGFRLSQQTERLAPRGSYGAASSMGAASGIYETPVDSGSDFDAQQGKQMEALRKQLEEGYINDQTERPPSAGANLQIVSLSETVYGDFYKETELRGTDFDAQQGEQMEALRRQREDGYINEAEDVIMADSESYDSVGE